MTSGSSITFTRLASSVLVAAVISLMGRPAIAKELPSDPPTVDVKINSVTANHIPNASGNVSGWAVYVRFTAPFDVSKDSIQVTNPGNYRIINVSSGSMIPVSLADFVQISGADVTQIRLVLRSGDALNSADLFHLFALKLTFGGLNATDPSQLQAPIVVRLDQKKVEVDQATTAQGINLHKPTWIFKSSKNRDDSDIYASYELTTARDKATTGTGDVKVAIPFFSNFWGRTSKFSPLADIKASSDEKADPDSLKFALEWFLPVYVRDNPDERFPYTAVDWINSFKVEAPKNFDNVNALWESRWLFPSSKFPWIGDRYHVFLDFFGGHELGKNIISPLKAAEGKALFRLMLGANLTIAIPFKENFLLKGVDFNASYIRRMPLKRELSFDKDKDGNLTLVTFGTAPKDYVDSKLTLKVNDFFGPYLGFEWGRLPPNYSLVDHKWTFGILFKSKVKVK
jgi:hypothetical protein